MSSPISRLCYSYPEATHSFMCKSPQIEEKESYDTGPSYQQREYDAKGRIIHSDSSLKTEFANLLNEYRWVVAASKGTNVALELMTSAFEPLKKFADIHPKFERHLPNLGKDLKNSFKMEFSTLVKNYQSVRDLILKKFDFSYAFVASDLEKLQEFIKKHPEFNQKVKAEISGDLMLALS